jgi:hypothetical protein
LHACDQHRSDTIDEIMDIAGNPDEPCLILSVISQSMHVGHLEICMALGMCMSAMLTGGSLASPPCCMPPIACLLCVSVSSNVDKETAHRIVRVTLHDTVVSSVPTGRASTACDLADDSAISVT